MAGFPWLIVTCLIVKCIKMRAPGHLASIALIGIWTNLTLLMGKIPAAGIYIIMVANVAMELLKFLLLYATFMIGFAISLHILRGELYPIYYGDPLSSFMTTFAMMIGELNFGDLIVDVS